MIIDDFQKMYKAVISISVQDSYSHCISVVLGDATVDCFKWLPANKDFGIRMAITDS